MLNKLLASELARYKRRPLYWSLAVGIVAGVLYKEYMDLLVEEYDIR